MKCNCCGCSFDKERVVELFDERHSGGAYYYYFPNNDFCLDCAEDLYDEQMVSRGIGPYEYDPDVY